MLGPAQLERMGMRTLMAVGRGSAARPRVVHLTYKPPRRRTRQKVVLVGKGVTFDSGGLNLKPGDSMLTMKSDMAGAAAVAAALDLQLVGVMPKGLFQLVDRKRCRTLGRLTADLERPGRGIDAR